MGTRAHPSSSYRPDGRNAALSQCGPRAEAWTWSWVQGEPEVPDRRPRPGATEAAPALTTPLGPGALVQQAVGHVGQERPCGSQLLGRVSHPHPQVCTLNKRKPWAPFRPQRAGPRARSRPGSAWGEPWGPVPPLCSGGWDHLTSRASRPVTPCSSPGEGTASPAAAADAGTASGRAAPSGGDPSSCCTEGGRGQPPTEEPGPGRAGCPWARPQGSGTDWELRGGPGRDIRPAGD